MNERTIDWLLAHPEPAIRRPARRDVLRAESREDPPAAGRAWWRRPSAMVTLNALRVLR